MKQNAVKEFFSSLGARIKNIDKKWYPAIGLGTVAVIAVIVVLIFSFTDARELLDRDGSNSKEKTSQNGEGNQVLVVTDENGSEVTYTPEQIADAFGAIKDAFNKSSGKIKFKNPFANIKPPSGTFTLPSMPSLPSSSGKVTSNAPSKNTTTAPKTTEGSAATTAPSTTEESSEPVATVPSEAPQE